MTPSQIGRYEVVRELGRGGMAVVYLARDPLMKRQVAIKVLPRQFTFDPQFRTRFQHEAEVIAALDHAFIVPVYDYGEFDEQPYIVMRYMSGGSLSDQIRQSALSPTQAGRIVERIGTAIDYAHTQGIIHRDLKPANVLFDSEGNAFLSDFGIAKIAESSAAFTGTAVLGTPEYMSPEQALGNKKLDGRTDIYSLGVVLFQMLTGQLPFEADTPMGAAVAHINQPVPDILAVNPALPPVFGPIIRRALAKEPEQRYQTGKQLADAMSRLDVGEESATLHEEISWTMVETPAVPVSAASTSAEPPSARSRPPAKTNDNEAGIPAPAAPRRSRTGLFVVGGTLALLLCIGLAATVGNSALRGFFQNQTPTLPVAALPNPPADTLTPTVTEVIPITAPIGLRDTYIEYILDGSGV